MINGWQLLSEDTPAFMVLECFRKSDVMGSQIHPKADRFLICCIPTLDFCKAKLNDNVLFTSFMLLAIVLLFNI